MWVDEMRNPIKMLLLALLILMLYVPVIDCKTFGADWGDYNP